MTLKNKVCLITGGGSGIGKATAIKMASEGAKIIVVGRTETKINETGLLNLFIVLLKERSKTPKKDAANKGKKGIIQDICRILDIKANLMNSGQYIQIS